MSEAKGPNGRSGADPVQKDGAGALDVLTGWPAPHPSPRGLEPGTGSEGDWEALAEKIERRLTGATATEDMPWLNPPALAAEPGEPVIRGDTPHPVGGEVVRGEAKMSSDQGGSRGSIPGAKKLSLKELAEKAKNTPVPPKASVPPPAASVPPPVSAPVASAPPASAPPALPSPVSEAPAATAPPSGGEVVPIAEAREKKDKKKKDKAKDKKPAAAAAAADPFAPSPLAAKLAEDEGSPIGPIIGIGLALLGIAAGAFFFLKSREAPAPAAKVEAKVEATAVETAAPARGQVVAEAPKPKEDGPNLDALPPSSAVASAAASVAEGPSGVAPRKGEEVAKVDPKFNPEIKAHGTLDQAIEKVTGPGQKGGGDAQEAAPAAKDRNQTIPTKPSQGKVASAVGAVMGGAKACVAGADDVSRATITFSPAGNATNVSVSGWAAAHGQSGCVKSALMGANVGAFSDPNFSFSVTIRP